MEQSKFYQIKNITEQEYTLVGCDGSVITRPIRDVDKSASVFTIQDAKDGDVLLFEGNYNSIVLFHGIGINGKGRINYHCKCDLGNYSFGVQGNTAYLGTIEENAEHYHPATKEQRDLLFQKMKEAGYEWDAEKKELKKIEQKPTGEEMKEALRTEYEKGRADVIAEMQNPAWSEEDKAMVEDIIEAIDTQYAVTDYNEMVNWLKSIKDRYTWKPSELQIEALESATENCAYSEYQDCLRELIAQLKELREG